LKTTVEVAEPVELPVPLSVMFEGVAEMKEIEPIAAWATVTVPVALKLWLFAVVLAVMTSAPLQPLATYVALAVPVVVVIVAVPGVVAPATVIDASPWPTQAEVKVICDEVVYSAPVWSTRLTCKLVLPPADKDLVAMPIAPASKLDPVPLPSDRIVVVPDEVVPELVPELDDELWPVIVLVPPQAASSATQAQVMIVNLRISIILAEPVVLVGINRDWIPHAESWA
jgi:hypothetical protein